VLVDILDRCLAKRPSDRWESALQLRDTLRRVQRDGSLQLPNAAPSVGLVVAPIMPPPSLSREAGDDRFGHRAEDWAPRRVVEPAPAPRQLPAVGALPPVPQLPPLPLGADRSAQRAWKKAQKEAVRTWRQSVKEQRKANSAVFVEQLKAQQLANMPNVTPATVADRVSLFRKHVKWLGVSAAVGSVSLVVGASLEFEPLIVPFVGGMIASIISAQLLMMDFFKLRKMGVTPLAAWRDDWQLAAARLDTRTHAERLRELTERHANPVVMQSKYGETVRNADGSDRTVEVRGWHLPKQDWLMDANDTTVNPPPIKRRVMDFGYAKHSKIDWIDCV
jgi:serine/threonine-protein kinase